MKAKLLILGLFCWFGTFAQTSVPNTTNFSLSDVTSVVTGIGSNDLVECFAHAVDAYFDPTYKGSKNSLYNFRNYTIPAGCTRPTGLTHYHIYYAIEQGGTISGFYSTFGYAAAALSDYINNSDPLYPGAGDGNSGDAEAANLNIGTSVYLHYDETDCTYFMNGWFLIAPTDINSPIYHISGGMITEIAFIPQ